MSALRKGALVLLLATAAMLVVGLSVQAGEDRQGTPDPILFSTFVGGGGTDWPHSTVVAPNGTIYVTGYTLSFDFPTTEGAYQRVIKGKEDVFVACLSPDGSELKWSTLIGGSGLDIAWDIALGSDGKVYVTGETESTNFPTTRDAYKWALDGSFDAFVTCLSADGGSLVFSTLLGGEDDEEGFSIEALSDGSVLVAGSTNSMFFPTTTGAYDRSIGGTEDAFVARISSDGRSLQASTYLGGSYSESEPSISVDGSGTVWIAGSTTSQDFPTTAGLPNDWSLARDVFISALSSDLRTLSLSTVVGQVGSDVPRSIDIGPDGEIMVAGYTHSPEFPTTGPEPGNDNSGNWDAFILVYDGTLASRTHAWLYGGGNYDVIRAARYGKNGHVHVTGYTNSTNFPTTPGSYKPYKSGDNHDMFYMVLDADDGYTTLNSTYIGKSMGDFGMGLDLDPWGIPVIAGHSRSNDFPMEGDPYDDTHDGGGDVVVLKYTTDEDPPTFSNDRTPGTAETGDYVTYTVDVADDTGVKYVYVHLRMEKHDYEYLDSFLMEGNGTYSATVGVEGDSHTLNYKFVAWDVLGHMSETEEREIALEDTIPPELVEDESSPEGTTDDTFEFRILALDNWFVGRVKVEYVIGERNANVSMMRGSVDHGYSYWNATVHLAADSLDPIEYRFHIEDSDGNLVSTNWTEALVYDDDAPIIGELDLPSLVQPGSWLTVDVVVADNIGVASAWVEYFTEVGQTETLIIDPPYGPRLKVDVPVPTGRGDLYVSLHVEDAAGNSANESGVVPFRDEFPPEMTIVHEDTTTTGATFTLTWTASDPAGIQSMWGYYMFGTGHSLEDFTYFQAEVVPTAVVEVLVPGDSVEPLVMILAAKDNAGNVNRTEEFEIPVLDDDPPVADAGEDLRVKAPGMVRLEAIGSSDNVGLASFTWSWSTPGFDDHQEETRTVPWIELNLTASGDYLIDLRVVDHAGNEAHSNVLVSVGEDDGSDGGSGTSWYVITIIATVAIVIAVSVSFIYLRKGD